MRAGDPGVVGKRSLAVALFDLSRFMHTAVKLLLLTCSCASSDSRSRFTNDKRTRRTRGRRLSCKWILRLQADKITAIAQHRFRFAWQLAEQFSILAFEVG